MSKAQPLKHLFATTAWRPELLPWQDCGVHREVLTLGGVGCRLPAAPRVSVMDSGKLSVSGKVMLARLWFPPHAVF